MPAKRKSNNKIVPHFVMNKANVKKENLRDTGQEKILDTGQQEQQQEKHQQQQLLQQQHQKEWQQQWKAQERQRRYHPPSPPQQQSQHQQQQQEQPSRSSVVELREVNNAFTVHVDADLLDTIPFADDSEGESEGDVGVRRCAQNGSIPSSPLSAVPNRQSVSSPLPNQQNEFRFSASAGLFPPPPPPPPRFTITESTTVEENDAERDCVFLAEGASGQELSPAEKMFAEMTRKSNARKRSSDPLHYKLDSEDDNTRQELLMTRSLPSAEVKEYSCIKAYKLDEQKELREIAKKLNITIDSASETSSKPDVREKPQRRKSIMHKGFSFSKTSKQKRQVKQQKRGTTLEDLLCSSGSHEDRAGVVPYSKDISQVSQTISEFEQNGEIQMSNVGDEHDEVRRLLLQGARSRLEPDNESTYSSSSAWSETELEHETVERKDTQTSGETDEKDGETSRWSTLKNSLTKAFQQQKQRKSFHKERLLLMQAPKRKGAVNYEKDKEARKMQYESFCKVYPGIVEREIKTKTVNTFEDMERCIKKFFKKKASRAILAVIIFNGHGSNDGLVLSEDKPVPLDTFISKVASLLEEHREEHECVLPHRVKIVFAQCYGHLYTEPQQKDIQVISFTNAAAPKTQAAIKLDPLTREVESSSHEQLHSFASRSSLAEDTLAQIRNRSRNASGLSHVSASAVSVNSVF